MRSLVAEKRRADTMRRCSSPVEARWWDGYLRGLTAEVQEHEAILGAVGSEDLQRAAYARGYRDGRAFISANES